MKKILCFATSLVFSIFVMSAENFSAQVISVTGKAEVLSGGSWKSLSAGDNLNSGDIIQTGFKSGLSLKIKESTVNVSPLTRVTVENLSENAQKDNVSLFVDAGGVSSSVRKASGKKVGFTVRTPVATASVRGTDFSVQNGFDSVDVNTKNGSVAVWNSRNSVRVAGLENKNAETPLENAENIENFENFAEAQSFEKAPRGTVFVNAGQALNAGAPVKPGNSAPKTIRDSAARVVFSMPSSTTSAAAASDIEGKGAETVVAVRPAGTSGSGSSLAVTIKVTD